MSGTLAERNMLAQIEKTFPILCYDVQERIYLSVMDATLRQCNLKGHEPGKIIAFPGTAGK